MTLDAKPLVHVIGLGSMGAILAVDLLRFADCSVVPMFRSKKRLEQFQKDSQSTVGIRKLYLKNSPLIQKKFTLSACPESFTPCAIKNLVVTTKTYQTKESLVPYLPFIDQNTNLILIQNGLGVVEVLKEEVFTDVSKRPQLFQGVISHGCFQDQGFVFNHAGAADLKVSRLPWDEGDMVQTLDDANEDMKNNELIKLFTSKPFAQEFNVKFMTYQELLLGQLYKFLVNACMNSVTAILDCVNGEMVGHCSRVFELIVDESLQVLRLAYKPLFDYEENYSGKDTYPQLKVNSVLNTMDMVKNIENIGCVINGKNSSSMRQDTLYLRDTEIEYINGYIVSLGQRFQVDTKVNKTIQEFVNLRLHLNRRRASMK
ncbi:PAN5 (YHR063C) [Zygosaccharomyces parabailii]|uniref:2-dehydropantoate 2-reductase n=1 Tax=Zygosaccharomyces bailii (strain CLIB 213 / ATCC 58445 / CBS 680 / BCRC 21525 / NBRC 1098 / NCYC 1416 / NRRL Y-2227) TaxID=1333698 RepID=A0A8J2X5K7_ZYGB2|nr:PAN5 (YHR063C) [Zygosaccharomyces parabailii]CDF87938.1 BN860_17876g1_1 [Zygosaccharomyces bailii CLIB 213]